MARPVAVVRGYRDRNGEWHAGKYLSDQHRRELQVESSILPEVIEERGYETITRPSNGDFRNRERLQRLRIPPWALNDTDFAGLLMPMYGPTGRRVSCQWKPRRPARNYQGKAQKYVSPKGVPNHLDVHPRNKDKIVDPAVELWITEGIKKGDSFTSWGLCVISLTGVFNWRTKSRTVGDWEDVLIKGREIVICFDADTLTNKMIKNSMIRVAAWLRSRAAKKVSYVVAPREVNGMQTKGVDDYFAAGGL